MFECYKNLNNTDKSSKQCFIIFSKKNPLDGADIKKL